MARPLPQSPTALANAQAAMHWLRARAPAGAALVSDSRAVRPGDVFLAWPGRSHDGRRHVAAALEQGASACLVEAEGASAWPGLYDARVATLANLKSNAAGLAAAWYPQGARQLRIVATTGTNGKTSTAWWMAQALNALDCRAGVVGTLGVGFAPAPPAAERASARASVDADLQATGLTTPDVVALHASLASLVAKGAKACAIEASSIGLEEGRLEGVPIAVALFTNLTQDHLDYHGSMQAYWASKQRLFAWPGLQAAVINVDDAHGQELAQRLAAEQAVRAPADRSSAQDGIANLDIELTGGLALWTVSTREGGRARLQAGPIRYEYLRGAGPQAGQWLSFEVAEQSAMPAVAQGQLQPAAQEQAAKPHTARTTVRAKLVGEYNANNLMVVLGGLRALGYPLAQAAQALAQVSAVPGRMQLLEGAGIQAVVDYAHTPDAISKVLAALRPLAQARQGRLICVMGCGGDRDPGKRPLMARAAEQAADVLIFTSDNPRSEQPAAILAQMLAGLERPGDALSMEDRAQAIAHAMGMAEVGDVVLIAGKGHEDYQEVAGVRRPFSDVAQAQAALRQRAMAQAGVPSAHSGLGGELGGADKPTSFQEAA